MRITLSLCLVLAALLAGCSGCKRATAGQQPAKGRDLFAAACARCHGTEGGGGLAVFDGGPTPRNFRDHAFQTSHTDEQLKKAIVEGKPPGMPPFGTAFDEEQLRSLVEHVRSLDPGN